MDGSDRTPDCAYSGYLGGTLVLSTLLLKFLADTRQRLDHTRPKCGVVRGWCLT